ncbi:MAG: hypothetical protein R2711_11975 [Acidimicrobiales bacterium]
MGLDTTTNGLEVLDHNVVTAKLEDVIGWKLAPGACGRPPSAWPAAPSR